MPSLENWDIYETEKAFSLLGDLNTWLCVVIGVVVQYSHILCTCTTIFCWTGCSSLYCISTCSLQDVIQGVVTPLQSHTVSTDTLYDWMCKHRYVSELLCHTIHRLGKVDVTFLSHQNTFLC